MATKKQTVWGTIGAVLLAASGTVGINKYNAAPPIPVAAAYCVDGKTTRPVTFKEKDYAKGAACIPTVVVPPKKKKH